MLKLKSDENISAIYGDGCAEFYDEIYRAPDRNVIRALSELSSGGRVLELGIGTGRVALSLLAEGFDVSGIEASQAMIERLRAKPNGANIPVHLGNFADVNVEGKYSLIFTLVNTFFLLIFCEEQQRCLENIASHLTENGVFLMEYFIVPNSKTGSLTTETIQVVEHQIMTRNGLKNYRVRLCSVTLETLDEMAENAGLRLRERWKNWSGDSLTDESMTQISIYELEL